MKNKMKWAGLAAATLLSFSLVDSAIAAPKLDRSIKSYQKANGVGGNLNSIGSDTLNNLMTYWAEGFRKKYPNVNIQIEGKGSSTAPPALIKGTSQLGPMSRKMKNKELEAFEKAHGFKPMKVAVALDSLAVFVNKDNPIKGLNLKQVDAIFSSTRKGGHKGEITKWGQVGLTGKFKNMPVSLFGRNSASGTYGYFKKKALFKGDYKATVKEQPGSSSVIQGITEDVGGIGYSGIGYLSSGVRAIALTKKGTNYIEPSYANVLSGKYPLGRQLYVYISKQPGKPVDKLTKEFLKFALSKEGQKVVIKDGYLPLTGKMVEAQLKLLK